MSRLLSPRRCPGFAAAALLLTVAAAVPAWGAPNAASPYPPASLFRSLQLITLACGRDNSSGSCEKARTMADPLLDHPRLSARCKDMLWAIRQNAQVAPQNSYERREGIDRAARDVTLLCRQPATAGAAKAGSGSVSGSGGAGAGAIPGLQVR